MRRNLPRRKDITVKGRSTGFFDDFSRKFKNILHLKGAMAQCYACRMSLNYAWVFMANLQLYVTCILLRSYNDAVIVTQDSWPDLSYGAIFSISRDECKTKSFGTNTLLLAIFEFCTNGQLFKSFTKYM